MSGFRAPRGARQRWYRLVAAVLVAFALVLVTDAARPRRSDASWVALLAQTTAQLKEATDLIERHTRQFEDHVSEAAGMIQPFTEIHAGYKELTDFRRIKGLVRMGDLYRSEMSSPECFDPANVIAGRCRIVADFLPTRIRTVGLSAGGVLADVTTVGDGVSFDELEGMVRRNLRHGVGGQWLDSQAPPWVTESLGLYDQAGRTYSRVRAAKARAYRAGHRALNRADTFRHMATDVLRVTTREGDGSGEYSQRNGVGDYRADADGRVECGAGTTRSMSDTTLNPALSYGSPDGAPTLYAQVLELDCNDAGDPDDPEDPETPGAHASPTQQAAVAAGLGVWQASMAAAELEDEAEQLSTELSGVQAMEEVQRRRIQRAARRVEECEGLVGGPVPGGCAQYEALLGCSPGQANCGLLTYAEAQAHRESQLDFSCVGVATEDCTSFHDYESDVMPMAP